MSCIQSGGIYALVNVKGGTCLDLSGADNHSIIGYGYHNGPNQAWLFERQGNGNYQIKSISSNQYLSINGQPGDGVPLVAKSTPFEWHIEDDPRVHQAIRLFVPGTFQNIDLSDHGNPKPGTPITLWGRWDGDNQLWYIQSIGG